MAAPQPPIVRYLNTVGRDKRSISVSSTKRGSNRTWNLPYPFLLHLYRTGEVHNYGEGITKETRSYVVRNLFDFRYVDFASPIDGQLWPLNYTTRKTPSPNDGILWPRGDKVKR